MRTILSGLKILVDGEWITQQAVILEDTVIRALIPEQMIPHHLPASHYALRKGYLVPGFIDLHVHGAKGRDVMDASLSAFHMIGEALAEEGVTAYLPTTMTSSDEQLESVLRLMPEATQHTLGAAILGLHLEGPFISNSKAGAQQTAYVQAPNIKKLMEWQKLSGGNIKRVTLAPEKPGALELIAALRDMNMLVSAGHTNATYEEMQHAIEAGCHHATHLFNAMRGIHQRDPGAAGAFLLSRLTSAEIIVDGLHLHPALVRLILILKGKDGLQLVSDAMRAKCLGEGHYDLGGQTVHVKNNKATLADGTLAGSLTTIPQAIKNMIEFTGCTLAEACKMASYNPAHLLGISERKGAIGVGKDADLVVLDESLNVMLTFREGKKIFQAERSA